MWNTVIQTVWRDTTRPAWPTQRIRKQIDSRTDEHHCHFIVAYYVCSASHIAAFYYAVESCALCSHSTRTLSCVAVRKSGCGRSLIIYADTLTL